MTKRIGSGIIIAVLLLVLSDPTAGAVPKPPEQPATGPGGRAYRHASITQTRIGEGSTQYWVYEPAEPTPATAPVVVFLHGWTATNPKLYGGWLSHLVRRGNIVIFPRYQASALTPPTEFASNAAEAIVDALRYLKSDQHVRPDTTKVAFVGHSAGGTLTANLAAEAPTFELPVPKAVMCVEPAWQLKTAAGRFAFADLSRIPPETLLLSVAGDSDVMVGQRGARMVFRQATRVLPKNKNLIIVQSDFHGFPPLQASHLAPMALDKSFDSNEALDMSRWTLGPVDKLTLNALDYYGFWKLLDALMDAAFYGKNRNYALGDTPQQRFMGTWSDGVPVKELSVTQK